MYCITGLTVSGFSVKLVYSGLRRHPDIIYFFMETQENQNPSSSKISSFKAVWAFIWDLVKILAVALAIIIPFRLFVAEPFVVSGNSMLPNFHGRDYLIIDRISYHIGLPRRGDVIVLRPPKSSAEFYIKRLIALPGETIRLSQGRVFISNQEHPSGFELQESYAPANAPTLGALRAGSAQTLGSNEYFVLGDNRTGSNDSRNWGALPRENIIGKVWLAVYSQGRLKFELFKQPTYNDKN